MEQPIMPIGVDNFEKLRRLGGYYVDKTPMLSKLLKTLPYKPILFTRPHHFGKTLTLSMMESFFDIRKDNKEIFKGLAIMEEAELCAEWMNQYPTIFFSFKNIECRDFASAYGMLKLEISRLCRKFLFLKDSEKNDSSAIDYFLRLLNMEESEAELKGAFSLLMEMLYQYYNKPVILLLDAYDTPIVCAKKQGYEEEMLDVINGMFNTALQEDKTLKFAVISGCLLFSPMSFCYGAKNCSSYSVLENDFSDSFGFTKFEVTQLFIDSGWIGQSELMKKWYGGYIIGKNELYCPWDVMYYIMKLQGDSTIVPEQISSSAIFPKIEGLFAQDRQDKFEALLHDKVICEPIVDGLSCDSMDEDLWSILLMEGYLTKTEDTTGSKLGLKIPNKKIKDLLEEVAIRWINNIVDADSQKVLMDALWESDTTTASKIISNFLIQIISSEDCHEDFYCTFLSKILKGVDGIIDYNIGQESGKPSLVIKDRKNRSAIIIEAKKAENMYTLNKACDEGIVQIITRQYEKDLGDGFQNVLCYSMSFYQKTCMVKKLVIGE